MEREVDTHLPDAVQAKPEPRFTTKLGRWALHTLPYLLGTVTILLFLWNSWWAGHFGLRILATAACLVMYYRAEALEVAFTMLRAKDHDTLLAEDRKLLKDFCRNAEVFRRRVSGWSSSLS